MTNAAIEMARKITALVPAKPAPKLLGCAAIRQEQMAYYAAMAGAVGAWKYAAHVALNEAISAAPSGGMIDYNNHECIKFCNSITDLEAMCSPTYPWSRH